MENLNIAIDFGGSGLKVVASCDGRVIAFRIGPQIIEIFDPKPLEQEFSIDLTKNLWVGCSDAYYSLGALAADQYHSPIPLVAPKRTYIIPRTLGAVASAAHRFGINGTKRFKVNLQLLLPAAEFSQERKKELSEQLASAIANFDTPIGQMKAKFSGFSAKPEGFGIMRRKMNVTGIDCQQEDTAVVMFGHRNTSLYLFSGGGQRHYRSNDTGFIRAIEAANVDQVKAIANPELVDEASIMGYWNANKLWLNEKWPEDATTAIVGGGPIGLIGGNITRCIDELLRQNPKTSTTETITFLHGGMPLTIHEENRMFVDPEQPLLRRWPRNMGISDDDKRQFADVYCLWATGQKVVSTAN